MQKPLAPVLCAFLLVIPAADTQAQGRTTDLILGAGGTMSFATDRRGPARRSAKAARPEGGNRTLSLVGSLRIPLAG